MKSVLISGGLGFVGVHLTEALLRQGCQITLVDSCQTNVVEPQYFEGRCSILVQRIEDSVAQLSKRQHFDQIYHLASVVGPAGVLEHAGDIARSVILSGQATIDLALHHNARLVLISTSEVYGRRGPLAENLDCFIPAEVTVRLEYAAAKLTSEIAALNRAKVTPLQVNVVRPFNISGPRQLPDGGFVLPRFVTSALTGAPITVFGDGSQVRAFTDVRDIVSGLTTLMNSQHTNLVLNLGNPANEITILQLAQEVKRLAASSSEITLVDPKTLFGDLYEEGIERVPVVDRALSFLPWKPMISLDQTIRDTIEFYRSRPDLLKVETLLGAATGG